MLNDFSQDWDSAHLQKVEQTWAKTEGSLISYMIYPGWIPQKFLAKNGFGFDTRTIRNHAISLQILPLRMMFAP